MKTTCPRTSSNRPSPRSEAMNSSAVISLGWATVDKVPLPQFSIRNRESQGSDRPGHGFGLHQRAILLLGQVVAAVLDPEMVPGEDFLDGPRAVAVERDVDAELGERVPPKLGVEVLGPGVQPRAAAPGGLQRGR